MSGVIAAENSDQPSPEYVCTSFQSHTIDDNKHSHARSYLHLNSVSLSPLITYNYIFILTGRPLLLP